jgi:hypothetical protein
LLLNDQGTKAYEPSILDFGGCPGFAEHGGQASRRPYAAVRLFD